MNNQINVDKSAIRLTVRTGDTSSTELMALEERSRHWLSENAPRIRTSGGTGAILMFSKLAHHNIRSMLGATSLALVLTSFLLMVAFHSVKIGLISLAPNLAPSATGFGIWGLFVGEAGFALSAVMGMTLGIVVDDTVHFLSGYLRARREQHVSSPEAVVYAYRAVGRVLLITSAVLIVGFLVLATSGFKVNGAMGMLTAIIIAMALVADFLLPPLLMSLEGTREGDLADVMDTALQLK